MANIEVIEYEKADNELRSIYDDIISKRGKLADVHMIQSLNPQSIVKHMDLYMTIMFGKSPLTRVQREMIAVVVSKSNDCEYCQLHHAASVLHYWKDEKKTEQLKRDFTKLDLSPMDLELCRFAQELTLNPSHDSSESIQKLKDLGLDDRSILDASLVIAYFNFVNRIVMGLGLDVKKEEIEGYNFE